MVIEISCLNTMYGIVFLAILALVGGTSAPKDSPRYKTYVELLGMCILFIVGFLMLSIGLGLSGTTISLTVAP
jgi:hypothetical protein